MLSLIELCCKVLAQNFTAIESLEYIPEHLGRLICAYISQDLLNDRVLSLRLFLNLFSQAYGGSFLSSFRLRQCPDFTRWIEAISICITLTALNVDSCGLGGEFHELLPWLGRLEGVKFLSIRWNNLTNDGIRSLTANWRGSGRSNCKLAVVDVSGNPFLGEVSLRLLTGIVSLQMLYLSDTGLAVSTSDLPHGWAKRVSLERLVPRFPEPSGWLWDDFGSLRFPIEKKNDNDDQYEIPLVVFRLRSR